MSRLSEVEEKRKELILYLKASGINPFGKRFITEYSNAKLKENIDKLYEETVKAKGRVIAIRGYGKASFVVLRDFSGDIQTYFRFDVLGEEKYNFFKKAINVGDFVGVEGNLLKPTQEKLQLK